MNCQPVELLNSYVILVNNLAAGFWTTEVSEHFAKNEVSFKVVLVNMVEECSKTVAQCHIACVDQSSNHTG